MMLAVIEFFAAVDKWFVSSCQRMWITQIRDAWRLFGFFFTWALCMAINFIPGRPGTIFVILAPLLLVCFFAYSFRFPAHEPRPWWVRMWRKFRR